MTAAAEEAEGGASFSPDPPDGTGACEVCGEPGAPFLYHDIERDRDVFQCPLWLNEECVVRRMEQDAAKRAAEAPSEPVEKPAVSLADALRASLAAAGAGREAPGAAQGTEDSSGAGTPPSAPEGTPEGGEG